MLIIILVLTDNPTLKEIYGGSYDVGWLGREIREAVRREEAGNWLGETRAQLPLTCTHCSLGSPDLRLEE